MIQTVTMIGARKLPICAPLSIIPIQVPYTLVGKSSVKYITKTVKTKVPTSRFKQIIISWAVKLWDKEGIKNRNPKADIILQEMISPYLLGSLVTTNCKHM